VETKNINDLIGNKKNPRTMSKHDADALKKSIEEFGDLSGIVFNIKTNQLVGGHQRIETFKRMTGERNVVITQRFDTPNKVGTVAVGYITFNGEFYGYREVDWPLDRETAANIAANRIQGEFDLDLLAEMDWWLKENNPDLLALTGQTDDEISRLLDAAGPSDEAEDDVPEVDESVPGVSKLGEIYQLGNHRLMCGDSTDESQVSILMNGKLADMIFTDPPYGVDYVGGHNEKKRKGIEGDTLAGTDLTDLFKDALTNAVKFSTNKAAFYIWYANGKAVETFASFATLPLEVRCVIAWYKVNSGLGAFMSQYIPNYEPCIYAFKTGGSVGWYGPSDEKTVWELKREGSNDMHPTQKPVELSQRAIRNSSQRGELVLDLFGGSGATLISADTLDRSCYMMEFDPRYVDVIRKRYWRHVNDGNEEGWEDATKATQEATVGV
jgi:DNA modification methylase